MNKETAKITLQFLERVDLKGAEVPAFNGVVASLSEIITREEKPKK